MQHKTPIRRGAFNGYRGLAGVLALTCIGCSSQRITDGNDNSTAGTYTVDHSASMDSLQDSMNSLENQARLLSGDMAATMAIMTEMIRLTESATHFIGSQQLVLKRDGTAELIGLLSTSTSNLDSTMAFEDMRGTWSASGNQVTINLTGSSGTQSKTLGILRGNNLKLTTNFDGDQLEDIEFLVLTRSQ